MTLKAHSIYIYLKLVKVDTNGLNRQFSNHNSGRDFLNSGRVRNAGLNYVKIGIFRL